MVICDKADEVIKEVFKSLLTRYQIGLETSRKVVILTFIALICCVTNDVI